MENKNANNYWTVSPIITKFGMQSLMRTPKVPYAQKSKNWKSKMAADAIIFFVFLWITPWSNQWTDFVKRYVKTRFVAQGGTSWGLKW